MSVLCACGVDDPGRAPEPGEHTGVAAGGDGIAFTRAGHTYYAADGTRQVSVADGRLTFEALLPMDRGSARAAFEVISAQRGDTPIGHDGVNSELLDVGTVVVRRSDFVETGARGLRIPFGRH